MPRAEALAIPMVRGAIAVLSVLFGGEAATEVEGNKKLMSGPELLVWSEREQI